MGLDKRRPALLRMCSALPGYWWPPVGYAALCFAAALGGDPGRQLLRYDRRAVASGEIYRLVSGHFAHLNVSHLSLNLSGLLLVWLLVGRRYTGRQWLVVTTVSITVISGAFWYAEPDLYWYVGFSGVLHGLLLAGALRSIAALPVESVVLIALVVVKLVYEQIVGAMPGSSSLSGGPVVVDAHLYGAIGGAVAAALLWRRGPPRASI